MKKQDILHKISRTIHALNSKTEVLLFGSRARGTHRKNSDWDILLLVDDDKVTSEIENSFICGLYDIELELGQSISTLIYPKKYWENEMRFSPLYKNVHREGIVLTDGK